ncbi:SURF1 family protein [Hyphococcus sp.]|jgi:surfeit locus 1 family protein|uniref:SURF1 family protein n=1 Tax=Hyphococcus sp. TaxID=2038636 RepID=UPI003D132B8F
MSAYRFQFRPVLTVVGAIALAILIALGAWQLRRLEWKQDLIAQVEARTNADPIPFAVALRRAEAGENMEYAPVLVEGELRADQEARVFGTYDGQPGAYIFAPLETGDGAVYVNRGFAPQKLLSAPCFCDSALDAGAVTGLFRYAENPVPPASWFQPAGKSADGLWFVRNPGLFAADAEIDASPYYIDQFAVEGRDWPKGGTTRLDFSNRHLEYALTWFGLAATLVGVWIAFSLKKRD